MIDFIIVTSDLQPSVLGTWVKRGAELTTDSGGNARTRWWTPQMKRGFRLKESPRVGREFHTHRLQLWWNTACLN